MLQPVATDFLFSGNDILSFTFFWEIIIAIRGRPIFLKNLVSARRHFFQIMIRMEVAFQSSEIAFFEESFILASENGFPVNYKLLFGAFFCWWTQFLKLSEKQFSSIFSLPNSGSSFSGQWKRSFYGMLHSGEWK